MSKSFIAPEIDVLVKRQQNQCLGGVEIGVLKQGHQPVVQPGSSILDSSVMCIAVIKLA
jgi:hypothetical protein